MKREMRSLYIVAAVLAAVWATVCRAGDVGFAKTGDEMVEQMLGGEKQYSLTRSFVVKDVETRSMHRIRVRNKQGEEETVSVAVPVNGENVARLKVEFDVNSAVLRSSAYPLLAELGKALKDERVANRMVCIKGYTDSDGDDDYNLKLSFDRADAVSGYLQGAAGINVDTLRVFGYGESMPLVPNDSEQNKQSNRRVEVSLNCAEVE